MRKPYPYRGIEEYIKLDEDATDNEVLEVAGNDYEYFPQGFRQERTLTEESRLDEVLFKGDLARQKRDRRIRSENLLGLQLPSVDVFNFDLVLKPTRPLIPDAVAT